MNRFWRFMANVAAALAGLGFCASCPKHNVQPVYGVPIATKYGPPPIALQLEVKSFSFTPASPVHVGDTLVFMAELEPADNRQARVGVTIAKQPNLEHPFEVELHDDGMAPDATAGDNVFSGSAQWRAEHGRGQARAYLSAAGDKGGQPARGYAESPLEVKP